MSLVFAWVGVGLVSTGVDLAVLQHAAYRSRFPWSLPQTKSRRVDSYPGKGGVSIDLEPNARVSAVPLDSPAIRDRLNDGQTPATT